LQDYDSLELLILDNASDDDTEEIGREFAKVDPRVTYVRNRENIGAQANHNLAFELTRGEYFKWAAHDDWIEPSFLSRCIEALDHAPGAVLSFTHVAHTDDEGLVFRERRDDARATASGQVRRRFRSVIWDIHEISAPIFGVMRRSALTRTNLLEAVPEPDRLLVSELSLLGPFVQIPEILLFRYLGEGHKTRDSWIWVHHRNRTRRRAATVRLARHSLLAIAGSEHPWLTRAGLVGDMLVGFTARRLQYKYHQLRWRLTGKGDLRGFLDFSNEQRSPSS
jgi:glycosyltransferase involved in cell wall biosynthesis